MPAMAAQTPPKPHVEDVQEEDDLDDLDDILSKFTPNEPQRPETTLNPSVSAQRKESQLPINSSETSATSRTPFQRPRHNTRVDAVPPSTVTQKEPLSMTQEEDELTNDFARELAKGMESLMREIGADPGVGSDHEGKELTEEEKEQERVFKAAWEAMLVEGMDGMVPGGAHALAAQGTNENRQGTEKDDFQSKIRQAMNKLKESETNLQADSSAGASNAGLEAFLSSLTSLSTEGATGEGEQNDEELASVLENMMGQLMSKDILYDPLKELAEKFPTYLEENAAKLPKPDVERYELQLTAVRKIVSVFDDPGYEEEDPQTKVKLIEMMGEMQSYGSPPAEVMGPMPPGFTAGPDGMPQLPDGCIIS